ncbi:MAG: orotidine-5'-phosphate decarboxylase [Chlamydiota bacterium]|nr:orotidine-5'-phosphate decarboxylase [Chlamydiota bacterium]
MNDKSKRIIVALDMPDRESTIEFIHEMKGLLQIVKIGSVLFCKEGPAIIRDIRGLGLDVFLDLKFHDIPNTVAHAVELLIPLGIKMMTVHASGGTEMIRNTKRVAVETAAKHKTFVPIVLGVTALTSLNQQAITNEIGVQENIKDWVLRLSKTVLQGGGDGVVASAHELGILKANFGKEWITVCPGIRAASDVMEDQKRVMTAKKAFKDGAHYIVVGRPIYAAKDPRDAFINIMNEIDPE